MVWIILTEIHHRWVKLADFAAHANGILLGLTTLNHLESRSDGLELMAL